MEAAKQCAGFPTGYKGGTVHLRSGKNHQLHSVWGSEDYQNCGVASEPEGTETGSLQFWKYKMINK